MNYFTLIWRSLQFHARAHLGAVLGAAVGTAVLVGALLVGDSVRGSLRQMGLARLGSAEFALIGNDRFFRAQLAEDLSARLAALVAPVIQAAGTAASNDNSARANRVQVLGVDAPFWSMALDPVSFPPLAPDDVVLNQPLAEQLRVQPGDRILVRVDKPSRFSREAPLSPQEDRTVALRLTVRAVAADRQMGRFSLRANQIAPFTAFVPILALSERLDVPGRANLLLLRGKTGSQLGGLPAALQQTWQLADAELELRPVEDAGGLELRTRRVFLDPAAAAAGMNAHSNALGILTYFVNELRVDQQAAPYSMVAALNAPFLPSDLQDEEIVINQWLADDLQAQPGDRLALRYFTISSSRNLEERTNHFTIRALVPLAGLAADRTLMPDFPGIEKAESTRDWDSSLPIQLDRIRPQDEVYWKDYRGTPKAFLSLAAGQKLWANRFGDLTAIRYPPGTEAAAVGQRLLRTLDPAAVGLGFEPVRQQALAASDQAQDFGQLFLGFSFFLIVAALLLMALLHQFGIERRTPEIGTLLALGFTPAVVRRMLVAEGVALAVVGAVVGVPGGIAYAKAMLYLLSTVWRSAVGTSALAYHGQISTLTIGALSGIVVASLTVWLALRKQAQQPARELLAQGAETERPNVSTQVSRGIWVGWISSGLAMLTLGAAGLQQQAASPGAFFLAGTLVLISGLGFAAAVLTALSHSAALDRPRLGSLALRNATRQRRRSLATVGLLACGSFLIAAIGVFKLDSSDGVRQRSSGTGGFALIGESTFPIVHDLNTESGRQFFGLADTDLAGVRVVPLRVREGDDASCLNLNRAQKPALLGVQPEFLHERNAFTFAQVAPGYESENPWLLLKTEGEDGSVPAIGDAASIQWALGKKVGDLLTYTDEDGREFKVRLVAAVAQSVLQGSLIIGQEQFLRRYGSQDGYRMFLIDVDPYEAGRIDAVAASLSRAAQDYGLQLTSTSRRLAAFNAVQNTYLNTFQVLGGLGLLLGSIGLGVVVLRNVLERRGELALLTAVGFRARTLRRLILMEHGALLLAGLGIGVLAAFIAVLPNFLSPGMDPPWRSLGWTLAMVFCSGALWTWAASSLALRGRLIEALRNE